MQCTSIYPTPLSKVNLSVLKLYKKNLKILKLDIQIIRLELPLFMQQYHMVLL